jgi:hypothetical protein
VKQRIAKTLDEAIAQETDPLSKLVLDYTRRIRNLVIAMKDGKDAGEAKLAELAAMVDTNAFERVGTFRERVNWDQYSQLLRDWGTDYNWDCHVRRVSQQPGYVFLELTEFGEYAATSTMDEVCSVSIYEFDENNRIVHLDVYLQRRDKAPAPGSWSKAA